MGFYPVWVTSLTCLLLVSVLGDGGQPQQQQRRHSIYKELSDFVLASSNPITIPKRTLPIPVGVQCGIVAIHGVDREKNEMDVTRWGSVTWQSDLTWDPADYNGLQNISVPYHSIWLPDLHLYNANSNYEFIRAPNAVVFNSGTQAMFAHIRSKIHCGDRLDEDACAFRIASWGSNSGLLRINEHSENRYDMNRILSGEEFKGSPFEVLSYEYTKRTVPIADLPDTVDLMEFVFRFREKTPQRSRGPFKAMLQWG